MSTTTVLLSSFPPFPTLSLSLSSETPFSKLLLLFAEKYPIFPALDDAILSRHSGSLPTAETPLSALHDASSSLVTLRLVPRLKGGKGGFGSQLRAAGGRMSSRRTNNTDSCRDLNGRRLSTIKEAKKCATLLLFISHI